MSGLINRIIETLDSYGTMLRLIVPNTMTTRMEVAECKNYFIITDFDYKFE